MRGKFRNSKLRSSRISLALKSPVARARHVRSLQKIKKICKWCGNTFTLNSGIQKICDVCKTVRQPCACGCGELTLPVGKAQFKPPKFMKGHHTRTKKFRKWNSDFQKDRWTNLSVAEKKEKLEELTHGRIAIPNKAEKKLDVILTSLFPGKYKLNVNWATTIDGKIPDFVNVDEMKLVEMFGDYWHGRTITGRTKMQEERRRKKYFSKFGWNVAIVWEHELKNLKALSTRLLFELG